MKKVKYPKNYYVADTENTVPKSTITQSGETPEELHASNLPYEDNNITTLIERENVTRCWALALCEVLEKPTPEDVEITTSTEDFINSLKNIKPNSIIYFHNLSYDGPLLLSTLDQMGYRHTKNGSPATEEEKELLEQYEEDEKWEEYDELNNLIKNRMKRRTPSRTEYATVISGDGIWYSMKIRLTNNRVVEIRDSLKILPFSVDVIAKSLQTKYQKLTGSIDYTLPRPVGYYPTEQEIKYIKNDVLSMSEALFKIQPLGLLDNLTIGAACMKDLKARMGEDRKKADRVFDTHLPELDLETDQELRKAYKGAWCYNHTKGEIIDLSNQPLNKQGHVYDVNSLYPYVMRDRKYPSGMPREVRPGENFDLNTEEIYIVKLTVDFELKKDYLPFIQIRNSSIFAENEYPTASDGSIPLTMTSVDFKLMQEHYHIKAMEIVKVWKFYEVEGLFTEYIDHWYGVKETSRNNPVMYMVSKLMLNNAYGKLAQAKIRESGTPYFEGGVMKLDKFETESRGGHIPTGSFITAYAREYTIKNAQKNYHQFLYADTDSLHLSGPGQGLNLTDEIGGWDHEVVWDKARFVRQKTYIEQVTAKPKGSDLIEVKHYLDIKAAGCTQAVKQRLLYKVTEIGENVNHTFKPLHFDENDQVTNPPRSNDEVIERFTFGLVETGKLTRKVVTGGVILYETTFKILA